MSLHPLVCESYTWQQTPVSSSSTLPSSIPSFSSSCAVATVGGGLAEEWLQLLRVLVVKEIGDVTTDMGSGSSSSRGRSGSGRGRVKLRSVVNVCCEDDHAKTAPAHPTDEGCVCLYSAAVSQSLPPSSSAARHLLVVTALENGLLVVLQLPKSVIPSDQVDRAATAGNAAVYGAGTAERVGPESSADTCELVRVLPIGVLPLSWRLVWEKILQQTCRICAKVVPPQKQQPQGAGGVLATSSLGVAVQDSVPVTAQMVDGFFPLHSSLHADDSEMQHQQSAEHCELKKEGSDKQMRSLAAGMSEEGAGMSCTAAATAVASAVDDAEESDNLRRNNKSDNRVFDFSVPVDSPAAMAHRAAGALIEPNTPATDGHLYCSPVTFNTAASVFSSPVSDRHGRPADSNSFEDALPPSPDVIFYDGERSGRGDDSELCDFEEELPDELACRSEDDAP